MKEKKTAKKEKKKVQLPSKVMSPVRFKDQAKQKNMQNTTTDLVSIILKVMANLFLSKWIILFRHV